MTAFLLLYAILGEPSTILLAVAVAGLWCAIDPSMGNDR